MVLLKSHDLQCLVSRTSPTTAIDWLETYENALQTVIFDAWTAAETAKPLRFCLISELKKDGHSRDTAQKWYKNIGFHMVLKPELQFFHDLQCLVSGIWATIAIEWLQTYENALKTICFDAWTGAETPKPLRFVSFLGTETCSTLKGQKGVEFSL